jgi:penicillin-binding protein 1A
MDRMPVVQQTFWRTWRSLDPWTYKNKDSETEIPVDIRKWELTKLIRNSDRYKDLRAKYVGNIVANMQAEFPDFTFHIDDREIERLVEEHERGGIIAQLVKDNRISSGLAAQYRKALKSKHIPNLKTQWNKLQEAVKTAFDQEAEMTVFIYKNMVENWPTPKKSKPDR